MSKMKSVELYRQARYDEAEICAQKELSSGGGKHNALQVLGNIRFMRGDFCAALNFYRRSLYQNKNAADFFNIANTLFQLKKYRQSLIWSQKAVAEEASFFDAWVLQGQNQLSLEHNVEAVACFEKAFRLNENDFWVCNYLGQALQKTGHFSEGLKMSLRAVELSGGDDSQQINMAYALYETALETGMEPVKEIASEWQKKYSGNPIVEYAAAALDSKQDISKSDLLYVSKIFDIFADDFEATLTSLDYRVPLIISEECDSVCRMKKLSVPQILDIGCGTGFCGKFLDSKLPKMVLSGVDISSKMLNQAREKNIYKKLFCDDIERFLQKTDSLYDIIVAADVLTYFGALENIFFLVKKHLPKEGFFIFSVTQNFANEDDYFLHLSGRFVHSEKYIEKLAEKFGFVIKKRRREKLRNEGDSEVWGWIFCIKKSF